MVISKYLTSIVHILTKLIETICKPVYHSDNLYVRVW